MRIHSVTLNNIKSFSGNHLIDFSISDKINTVSGINGSGKTTIFKSIILAQKMFFLELYRLKGKGVEVNYKEELLNSFLEKNSYIQLTFIFDDETLGSFLLLCKSKSKNEIRVDLLYDDESKKKITEYWNIENPRNLIIYIDSNRNIIESDFSNKNIQISQQNANDLAIEYIFNPEKIFFSTYNRIVTDYLRERVIPSTPRADMAHFVSKILISDIINYLKIANFTGLERKDQFILQIKNLNAKKASFYDMRNLSSGEKTLFYIYHFICYIRNIGMLIIDEPENNLHENMLTKFVLSLHEICNNEDFSELIISTAKKNDVTIRLNQQSQISNYYKDHKLTQVFLLTHSKNLIYNNFTLGRNFVVNKGLEIMEYDNYEKKLREIGLSKIVNKVLFVEGKTENEILENIMSTRNIKVKPLGGCTEVIETYKRYLLIATEIRDVQFCFMIDRDTRSDEEINQLRDRNPAFFDEHFIILDKHEIENYFLEPSMFTSLFNRHKEFYKNVRIPSNSELSSRIKAIADSKKDTVIRKKIQSLNQNSLSKIKLAISNRSLPVDSRLNYEEFISKAFIPQELAVTIAKIKSNYEIIGELENRWDSSWTDLCDGKAVLYEFVSSVAQELQIQPKRIINELVDIGLKNNKYDVNKIIDNIMKILE